MTTEIKQLTLGRLEYAHVTNHGAGGSFQGTAHLEAALIDENIQLSLWIMGGAPKQNVTAGADLDLLALTALIGQLETMKAVLQMRLEANRVA